MTIQIREVSVEDRAYIAGFFDGEGCISSSVTRRGYFIINVVITNTNKAILQFVQSRFGGTINSNYDPRKTSRPCYMLRLGVDDAPFFVNTLVGIAKIKKRQLELASIYYSMRASAKQHEKEDYYFIDKELKELNKRGKGRDLMRTGRPELPNAKPIF